MNKFIKSFIVVQFLGVSAGLLGGCSSVPSNCDLDLNFINQANESVETIKADLAYTSQAKINLSVFQQEFDLEQIKTVLTNPSCFEFSTLQIVEAGSGRQMDYDYQPPVKMKPMSDIQVSVQNNPRPLPNDIATLQQSLNAFSKDKGSSDFTITEPINEYLFSLISDETLQSDWKEYSYFQLGGYVFASKDSDTSDPSLSYSFDLTFSDGSSEGKEALCNGVVIDAGGEQFFIEVIKDCGWAKRLATDWVYADPSQNINAWTTFDYLSLEDDVASSSEGWLRFLTVMAQNPFTVHLVDETGESHTFKSANNYDSKISAQKNIETFLEAKKAAELGLIPG